MIRLHITTEGQTEQGFVRRVLAEHLAGFHVFVDARCILTSRDKRTAKEYRGGLIGYEKAKKDILAWIKEDPTFAFPQPIRLKISIYQKYISSICKGSRR